MRISKNSVAVVTGAASGIGKGLALALAKRGCKLVLADINLTALEQVHAEVRAQGVAAMSVETDVAESAAVENLAVRAFEQFGRVDLLINNAGVLSSGASWELDVQEWKRVLDINLWSVIHAIHAFIPRLLKQTGGAHVVNIASLAGLTSGAWVAPYTVSKHGVIALSECLAAEMAATEHPVTISVVCPAAISTGIARNLNDNGSVHSGELNAHLRDLITHAMSPEVLAEKVLAGIEAQQFWIFPQQEVRTAAERRLQRILATTKRD